MTRLGALAGGGLAALLAAGCVSAAALGADDPPVRTATPAPATPTPAISGSAQLRSALAMEDKLARRDATLAALAVYLTGDEIVALNDEAASQALTDLAFSSGRITMPDPAFVRRAPGEPELAVVGVPDAIGLVLYDLRDPGQDPLLLTPWTAGLQVVFVTWGEDETGINYLTLGNDGQTRAHFLLVVREPDAGWRVTWYSDEVRNWWLNAYEGQLEVSADLDSLRLAGRSDGTTIAFDESAGEVWRTFETTWEQQGPVYALTPDPSEHPSYQEWLWTVARPGPYATLVEFLERLRNEDEGGASRLATSSVQAFAAAQLGLDHPARRYTVLDQTGNRIIFGDDTGTYAMTFIEPDRSGDKWLVADILPLTAGPDATGR